MNVNGLGSVVVSVGRFLVINCFCSVMVVVEMIMCFCCVRVSGIMVEV